MLSRSRFIRFFLLPLALVGSLGAGAAFAGGAFTGAHHGPPGPPLGPPPEIALALMDHVADEIGLSEDQQAELQQILEDGRVRGEELRAQHDGLRDEGLALFTADELDPEAIEAHRQKMLDLADEGSKIMVDTMFTAAQVLTPEQRAELATRAKQFHEDGGWRARMHERFGGERPFESRWH